MSDQLTEQFVLANFIETLDKIESHLDRIATAHEDIAENISYGFTELARAIENHTKKTNDITVQIWREDRGCLT